MEFDLEQARTILELTLAEYAGVRTLYYNAVYDSVDGYLTDKDRTAQKDMQDAITLAYTATAGTAWRDGNGDFLIGVAGVGVLLASRIDEERGHAATLFERLKELRKELQANPGVESELAPIKEARARAEGYSRSLDYFYAIVKLMALKDEPLFFTGLPGHESCPECEMLQDTWHKASWYIARGFVPPRGENLTCADGGLCEHILMDKKGQLVTI